MGRWGKYRRANRSCCLSRRLARQPMVRLGANASPWECDEGLVKPVAEPRWPRAKRRDSRAKCHTWRTPLEVYTIIALNLTEPMMKMAHLPRRTRWTIRDGMMLERPITLRAKPIYSCSASVLHTAGENAAGFFQSDENRRSLGCSRAGSGVPRCYIYTASVELLDLEAYPRKRRAHEMYAPMRCSHPVPAHEMYTSEIHALWDTHK